MCVSTRERNQFPSVRDRPLRHLSALESMGYERSGTVYRKTLLQIVLYRDEICIQRFAGAPEQIATRIVSDLLMSSDHLRRFGCAAGAVYARSELCRLDFASASWYYHESL
jgi:hypothetical protein